MKCPNCNVVNWNNAETCVKCGKVLLGLPRNQTQAIVKGTSKNAKSKVVLFGSIAIIAFAFALYKFFSPSAENKPQTSQTVQQKTLDDAQGTDATTERNGIRERQHLVPTAEDDGNGGTKIKLRPVEEIRADARKRAAQVQRETEMAETGK
ncbi:MAG: hypothetical protein ACK5NT_07845 [Pyrinomonadaceae bacterium]